MAQTPTARVVLYGMGPHRGPSGVRGIISDAAEIGASKYRGSGGEFHMTLPTNHPQAGACEPWQTHYSLQEWHEGAYVERFAGVISDFDATENDVVIYGIDYLALLDRIVDTRYVQGEPEKPPPDGSKHVSKTISEVVTNLLNYARNKDDSPVEFIDMGRIAPMPEKITIYSTFVGIGSFIQGLIDSHRQGSGKRSRLQVSHTSTGFEFRVSDDPGVERPGLKMQYGGLVQGFQIIGYGQFAARAHGIGRTQTGGELFYKSANAPGVPASVYGAIEDVAFYDNVADGKDLQRRVRQAAAKAAKVGKRIAIGLRVGGMHPFVGYSIGDLLPVRIKRGVIDTTRFGSGWWSVEGVEWRVHPDGNTELTLVVVPREDDVAPNPDLLVDQEVLPSPVDTSRIADGAISASKLADGAVTGAAIQEGAVGSAALAEGSVTGPAIAPGSVGSGAISSISADQVQGGTLGLGGEAGAVVEVRDASGTLIGTLTQDGIVMADPTDALKMVRLRNGVVEYSLNGGIDWSPAITSTGVVADAINEGQMPGGHNFIPNSGFEISEFSTPSAHVWTLAADWGVTIDTDVNVTKTGASLVMTTTAY